MDNAAGRTSVKHFVMQSLICKRTRLSLEASVDSRVWSRGACCNFSNRFQGLRRSRAGQIEVVRVCVCGDDSREMTPHALAAAGVGLTWRGLQLSS